MPLRNVGLEDEGFLDVGLYVWIGVLKDIAPMMRGLAVRIFMLATERERDDVVDVHFSKRDARPSNPANAFMAEPEHDTINRFNEE